MPDESLIDMADFIEERLKGAVLERSFEKNELVISVTSQNVPEVLRFLRDDKECRFTILVDVCGVDYPERSERFEVIYNLLSLRQNVRIRVKIRVEEDQIVPSVTGVFSSAGWFEREVWDMYGVPFSGNADLRRILTDYGFDGHPQRKDFPLTGYVELRYDEELKRVVYEPVKLTQDYRKFDYISPWEGMTNVQLAGDEKAAIPPHGWVDTNTVKKSGGKNAAEG